MEILFRYGANSAPHPPATAAGTVRRNSDPIHIATSRDNVTAIEVLLANKADPDARIRSTGSTALILAADCGHKNVLSALVSSGAKVNLVDNSLSSALHKACASGYHECVEILLKSNADVTAVDNMGETALFYAVTSMNHLSVGLLLDHDADITQSRPNGGNVFAALCDAGDRNVVSEKGFCGVGELVVQKYIQLGFDINMSFGSPARTMLHALCNVRSELCTVTVGSLLIDLGANLNAYDETGMMPIHLAASVGNTGLVRLFVERGAKATVKCTATYSTPIIYACGGLQEGSIPTSVETIQFLLDNGASLSDESANGFTALSAALKSRNYPAVQFLLSFSECDPATLLYTKKGREALFSIGYCEALENAFEEGLRARNCKMFSASVIPKIDERSVPGSSLAGNRLYDPNLAREVLTFLRAPLVASGVPEPFEIPETSDEDDNDL